MNKLAKIGVLALVAVAVAACSSPVGPGDDLGTISVNQGTISVNQGTISVNQGTISVN